MHFWDLPKDVQVAVHSEVARIKTDLKIEAEVLTLVDLARVLGVEVKSLWNLRTRDGMPKIPVLKLGQKDGYWIVHVAMWLMQLPIDTMPLVPMPVLSKSLDGAVGRSPSKSARATGSDIGEDSGGAKRSQRTVSRTGNQALLDKANELFEELERKRGKKK